MKRTILMLFVALSLGLSLSAQDVKNDNQRKQRPSRSELMLKRANRLADSMKLDDKTQAWFAPLYVEYQTKMMAIYHPDGVKNRPAQCNKVEQLTDAESLQLIENTFKKQEQKLALQKEYFSKFKKNLTPQQLVSIFYHHPAHKHAKCNKKGNKAKRAQMIREYKKKKANEKK